MCLYCINILIVFILYPKKTHNSSHCKKPVEKPAQTSIVKSSSATCLLWPPLGAIAAVALTRLPLRPQGDRMDREAMKCQVLTVSNHSCESLTLEGNTLECTVPTELQATSSKELQVEVSAYDSHRLWLSVARRNLKVMAFYAGSTGTIRVPAVFTKTFYHLMLRSLTYLFRNRTS